MEAHRAGARSSDLVGTFPAQDVKTAVGMSDPPRWEATLMRRKAKRSPSLFSALNGLFTSSRRRQQRRARIRQGRRTGFEMLEDRRLLAGTDLAMIQGLVFEDVTGNGFDPGEEIGGATVHLYADDGDGIFDPDVDELALSAVTDELGIYRFENLSAGNYFVQQPEQEVDSSSLAARVSPLITISESDAMGTEISILDSFDQTPQSISVAADGPPTDASSLAAPEALGGRRELFAELTSETGSVSLDVNGVVPGLLEFQSSPTAVARLVVTWDGPDNDPLALDPVGLEGVDLTSDGAATTLSLLLGADQDGGDALIRVYSDADNFSTATVAIPNTGGEATDSLLVHFSDFEIVQGAGADFTNVGAVQLEIVGSAGYDGQFSTIRALGPTVFTQDFDNLDTVDLAVTKTADSLTPAVESNVTFTITVSNLGSLNATGVEVTDILPVDLVFDSSVASQGAYDELTGVWQVGAVDAGAEATLELVALVATLGAKTNVAEVTAVDQVDSNPENDLDSLTIVPASIDLSLTKSVDSSTPPLGSNVTFTVIVSNAGPQIATGVEVTDQLPEGLQFVSADPSQGTYDSESGVWIVGPIEAGSSASLDLVATVTTLGEKTNTAEVTAADQLDVDSTPGNNDPDEDDQDSVTIVPEDTAGEFIDLELIKSADQTTPPLDGEVTFTIIVSNIGPNGATGVEVTDLLPEGLDFVSSDPSQGSYDSETGLWIVGAIDSGASATLNLVATVTAVGEWINTAEVTAADQPDLSSTPGNNDPDENDQDSVTILVGAIDLELTKSADQTTPPLDGDVTFTILVSNIGPSTATGVEVTDLLPEGLEFVSSSVTQGSYDSTTGVWMVGTIESEANATLEIIATVTTLGPKVNTAEVTAADQPDLSSTPGNNDPDENDQDSVTITPEAIDLSLNKTASDTAPSLGDDITFTILVSNAGPNTATGVEVTDLLPDGLTFVSATPSQGTYDAATGIWLIGAIESGSDATLNILVNVATIGAKVNTAEVTAAHQPDLSSTPGNNDPTENDQDSVTIVPEAIDLELTKSAGDSNPRLRSDVTFTIDVSNIGPNQATGVEVTDLLPEGLTFVSSTTTQGSYDAATGVWLVGTVDSSATATLEIVATVDTVGAKTNSAEVTAADQPDLSSTPGNNDPTENDQDSATIVPEAIDLSLAKTASTTIPLVGGDVTFTIFVSNSGPSTATGVSVLDQLPDGLTFISSTATQGSYDVATGIWNVGTIESGADATLELTANVETAGAKTNTAEVLTADQEDISSTPGNNDPTENDQDSITVTPGSGFSKRLFLAR